MKKIIKLKKIFKKLGIVFVLLVITFTDLSIISIKNHKNLTNNKKNALLDKRDSLRLAENGFEIYSEDFENISNYWDLYNVSERTIYLSFLPSDDTASIEQMPYSTISGDSTEIWADNATNDLRYIFIKKEFPYLYNNYTKNSILRWRCSGYGGSPSQLDIYTTSNFYEIYLTWNNQPTKIDYLARSATVSVGAWENFEIIRPYYYYTLHSTGGDIGMYTKESDYKPTIRHYLSKNYQGNGFLYMQTNETEILTLRSPNSLNLLGADIIEITFNTTSSNEICFNLRNGDTELKSYILSKQGNTNFTTRTVLFTINEDIIIDQLEFKGLFNDTNNLIVDKIRILNTPRIAPAIPGYSVIFIIGLIGLSLLIIIKKIIKQYFIS